MEVRSGQLERGSVIAGYRVDELISRGGMGAVYRVTHLALNRIYALKVLAPDLANDDRFQERFRREMRIAASLHHPNVVGIHYAGEEDGVLFLVMDYVVGTDLRQVMKSSGALEPTRACELVSQLSSALDAAHGRGLVHRDVKPANVLLTVRDGEEHAYLTDFGLAKKYDTVSGVGLTVMGTVVGTVDYMAPEQITGAHTDARTDIYALGCVFFQMLTGQVPYERDNSVATLYAHVHEPPPPVEGSLAELYPTFGAVIEKAMAKDPEDRYSSAGDFARDVTAVLHGSRYEGTTVVGTGEAAPTGTQEALAEPAVGDSDAARREPVPNTAHAESEADPRLTPTRPAARGEEPAAQPPATPVSEPAQTAPPAVAAADRQRPAGGSLQRYRWPVLAGLVVVCGAIAAIIALSSGGSSTGAGAAKFAGALQPVPTNRVTGNGTATVEVRGNAATVTVATKGLLPAVHLMHIHGGTGACPSASAAALVNGHRVIAAPQGDRSYGPVVTSLTTFGDTGPQSHLASARFSVGANIRYRRTISLPADTVNLIHQDLAVVVVHGINYDGRATYDDFLGPDVEAAAPALCGALLPTKSAAAGPGSGTRVYVASLHLEGVTGPGPALFCHIGAAPATAWASGPGSQGGDAASSQST
jgi:tRNA A-37 threonylcarbamoyl transferase component Bud32